LLFLKRCVIVIFVIFSFQSGKQKKKPLSNSFHKFSKEFYGKHNAIFRLKRNKQRKRAIKKYKKRRKAAFRAKIQRTAQLKKKIIKKHNYSKISHKMIAFLKKFYIGLRYKIKRRFRKKKSKKTVKSASKVSCTFY